ncbi:TPA: hypothetical protein DCX15_06690, partial [bacterium]|nr:hypothetical protein [bacterium]
MAANKVVVKYLDGRIAKGDTLDFAPIRNTFHLNVIETNEEGGNLGVREVDISHLKAVFFVKDFAGRPEYKERDEFLPGDEKRGKRITIEFRDGEKLRALTMTRADTTKGGFLVSPVDPESNNIRIFVVSTAVKEIKEPFVGEREDEGPTFNKVIVKYLDGKMLKGSTLDFDPTGDGFHLDVIQTSEESDSLGMRDIVFSHLKAVFFV